jgi:SNF2 family DNA or RNA helicase
MLAQQFITGHKLAPPHHQMRAYQIRAAHQLYQGYPIRDMASGQFLSWERRNGVAVHIDMGLGKTIIGLTAIVNWKAHGITKRPVLLVAPIKVCETVWRQEAQQWSHTRHLTFSLIRGDEKARAFALARPADVYLINPEGLKWLHKYLRAEWGHFDAMLIDESSMFKDNRSQRFRVLSNYGTQAHLRDPISGRPWGKDADGHIIRVPPHRFVRSGVLTGTPSPQSMMNLWSPFYLIDHGERLHRKYDTYRNRFFHKTQQVAEHVHKYEVNDEEAESRPDWQARTGAPERIHELIADITVELNAADYGVLPQTIGDASKDRINPVPPSHKHYVDLPEELRRQYDVLEAEAILELQKDTVLAQNGGAKSMMCWQFANGAIYRTDEFGKKDWVHLHDNKLDRCIELIDMLNANVLVPYYFKHDLARLKARFEKEGMAYSCFGTKNSERIVDQWNGGYIPILLIHPQSAAHGLNLQFGGHHLVWFTMLWSLERYLQTNARLARSGQSNIVGIHSLLTRNTTDDLMFANLGENGDDQTRFRSALRQYQQLRGMGLYNTNPLEGLGL